MKIYLSLIVFSLFYTGIDFIYAQTPETKSAGEISFDDNTVFNKVYLLQPGEHVVLKNLSSSQEIAIGLKNYLDISNRLALVYQKRDSLSLNIITQYEKLDKTIDNLSFGLSMISDSLKKVSQLNLQPSILLLDNSNRTLENSNKELSEAVVKLNEINSDLNKIQLSNIWKYIGFALGGLALGVIIGVAL